ncbi:MAG TPA: hypothetical protein VES42_16250 [Pilimelia sp.]|nr:hypothetical protein [Pilimelia sp.]
MGRSAVFRRRVVNPRKRKNRALPAVTGGVTVSPATISTAVAIGAPVVQAGATAAPATISRTVVIGDPSVNQPLVEYLSGGASDAAITLVTGSGTQVGDLLVAFHGNNFYTAAGLGSPTGTAGTWTLKATADAGSNSAHLKLWTRPVTVAGAQTVTVNEVTDEEHTLHLFVLRGRNLTTQIGASGVATSTGSSTTSQVAPGADPDDVAAYAMHVVQSTGNGNLTPAGATELGEVDVAPFGATSSATGDVLAGNGSTGTKTFTHTVASNYAAISVAIERAGAGGTDATATPATIAGAVTVSGAAAAGAVATPATIARSVVITGTAVAGATATPATIAGAATVSGTAAAGAAPAPVTIARSVTISGTAGAGAVVTPAAITRTVVISGTAGVSVRPAPAAIAGSVTVSGTPATGSGAQPATVAGATTISGTASTTSGSTATPATITASATVTGAPATGSTATPATVTGSTAVSGTAQAGARPTPVTVAGTTTISGSARTGATVQPATIARSVTISGTAQAGAVVTAAVLTGVVTISGTAQTAASATATPATVAGAVTIATPGPIYITQFFDVGTEVGPPAGVSLTNTTGLPAADATESLTLVHPITGAVANLTVSVWRRRRWTEGITVTPPSGATYLFDECEWDLDAGNFWALESGETNASEDQMQPLIVLRRCTLNGNDTTARALSGGSFWVTRCHITGAEDAWQGPAYSVAMESNFLPTTDGQVDPHSDGIQMYDRGAATFYRCAISAGEGSGANNALRVGTEFGAVTGVDLLYCWLDGGAYTLAMRGDSGAGDITDVWVQGCRWSPGPAFGPTDFEQTTGVIWQDNAYLDGTVIPSPVATSPEPATITGVASVSGTASAAARVAPTTIAGAATVTGPTAGSRACW